MFFRFSLGLVSPEDSNFMLYALKNHIRVRVKKTSMSVRTKNVYMGSISSPTTVNISK